MYVTFTPLTAVTTSLASDRTAASTDSRIMTDNMSDLTASTRTDVSQATSNGVKQVCVHPCGHDICF